MLLSVQFLAGVLRFGKEKMPNQLEKSHTPKLAGPVQGLLFFVFFYLYLWLAVDLRLIYHASGTIMEFPVFFRGWPFLREHLSYPGGLVEYLSAFFEQFFYIGWAGAFVVTLQAWLIGVCTSSIIKRTGGVRLRLLTFAPAIILLAIYTQYTHHFTATTGLLICLAFVCLFLTIAPQHKATRLGVYLLLLIALYTIAAGASSVFVACCAIYELVSARRCGLCLLYLLAGAVIAYVESVLIFNVSIIEGFYHLLPYWKTVIFQIYRRMITAVYILYALGPATMLLLGLCRPAVAVMSPQTGQANSIDKPSDSSPGQAPTEPALHSSHSAAKWLTESLVILAAAGATIFLSYNEQLKTLFTVEYYAARGMWQQVLATARQHPIQNYFVSHTINQALYYSGRMAYDMFLYPQHHDALFLTSQIQAGADWKKFDIYFDMGHVNIAEHGLVESVEVQGERPAFLKRLAVINMVKGKVAVARVFLNTLAKTLFDARWAEDYLVRLQADPNLSTDPQIQQLRAFMPQSDSDFCFGTEVSPDKSLLALLDANKKNRMAFEYLMALHLLTGQLDKFVQNLYRLDDFDYLQIPGAYEEAILLYNSMTKKPVDLHGRQISAESQRRFEKFNWTMSRYGGNKQAAFGELAKGFSNTYFFYYLYGPRD